MYRGKTLSLELSDAGIAELCFDRQQDDINKFDQEALEELEQALDLLETLEHARGLLLASAKATFMVGADITQFTALFRQPEDKLRSWLDKANRLFCRLEDLDLPTVSAVNGMALGGGLEVVLATDYRVLADSAKVGLPEVKLGIIPGFGGTVRLPRVIGADNAVEWIASGKERSAAEALAVGVADAVVSDGQLREAALDLLAKCIRGDFDFRSKRSEKLAPLPLNKLEHTMAFTIAKGLVATQAGPHYPAPVTAVSAMEEHATLNRDEALAVETSYFISVARTPVANALVGMFLNDQELKKISRKQSQGAHDVTAAAVVGAGIMGGGIAYQCASSGIPVVLKDIRQAALNAGVTEIANLLSKSVERGRLSIEDMASTLATVTPTLSGGPVGSVDVVIEAVVENENVKKAVLSELERQVKADTVLASNTSTISISRMAEILEKPDRFIGMHFFNPVHRMPLVEVIRGQKTSEQTVATIVNMAHTMGKTPIVVNDCPGFLVNRVLFPYFAAFELLMSEGADFHQVDSIMESFGWPMGPAYLLDVVGIDTAVHAAGVLADGYPERLSLTQPTTTTLLFEHKRLGQKSGLGFYRYQRDKKGKLQKHIDPDLKELMAQTFRQDLTFDREDVIRRMMIPMCLETSRCLEDGIVGSATEADMAMVMGLGFPPFIGGPLRYIDQLGVDHFVALCQQYKHLGPLYEPTRQLLDMVAEQRTFF